jgi:prophage regulatory protein
MAELGQTTNGGSRSGAGKAGIIDDREDRLLPWRSVRDITGISRTTAWRMQQTGDFPHPVPVSAKRVGWWESELTAWKARRRLASGERPMPCIPAKPSRPFVQKSEAKPVEAAIIPTEETPTETASGLVKVPEKRRGRPRPVSPDQIDFGF